MTEKIERVARTILWLVLAVAIVVIPLGILNSKSEVDPEKETMKEALKVAEDKIAELLAPKEPERFPVKNVGIYLSGLDHRTAVGAMTFTNTTSKSGFLCLKGVTINPSAGKKSESIPNCRKIDPYESNIKIQFPFAGQELKNVCPKEEDCRFSVSAIDGPQPEEQPSTK